jgi:hypothetical protein
MVMEIHNKARLYMVKQKPKYIKFDRWREYEAEKQRIQYEAKDAAEYERRIAELTERLGA